MVCGRLVNSVLAKDLLIGLSGVAINNSAFAGVDVFKEAYSLKSSGEILDRDGARFLGNEAISEYERRR